MVWERGSHHNSTTWRKVRKQALRELDYRCVVCGAEDNLELDHILNVARGGQDVIENVQWMCIPHHKQKTQREAAARRGKFKRRTPPPLGLGREGKGGGRGSTS